MLGIKKTGKKKNKTPALCTGKKKHVDFVTDGRKKKGTIEKFIKYAFGNGNRTLGNVKR